MQIDEDWLYNMATRNGWTWYPLTYSVSLFKAGLEIIAWADPTLTATFGRVSVRVPGMAEQEIVQTTSLIKFLRHGPSILSDHRLELLGEPT